MTDHPIAPLRGAATVVLVRDGADGIEVFLQRRVKQMAFAGGMTVFPGGGVDPRDGDAAIAWQGPAPAWWARAFHTDELTAQQLVCAAVRETFEECGVLLVTGADGGAPDAAALESYRGALERRELSLAEFLSREHLVLRADLLAPLAHWITPSNEKRRYDTRFFLAALPAGQQADDRTSEVDHAGWSSAEAALAEWSAGRCFLLPPTWTQLRAVAGYGTVAELLAAEHLIEAIEPDASAGFADLRFDGAEAYFASMPAGLRIPEP
jgi:8-oxo-dGTP pyrophosphatase MutT (NUDIX family)